VEKRWSDFPWRGEVCSGDPEEIWDVGLHAYVYAQGDQLEEASFFHTRGSGNYTLQKFDWLSNVSSKH
jgi:hypothetical protein